MLVDIQPVASDQGGKVFASEALVGDELDNPTHLYESPEVAAIRHGQEAWGRLRIGSTWSDWVAVGVAHVIGRTTAMRGRSLQDLVSFLSELHALHIDLFLHQQGLDTTTPGGKAMFQMMGVFAEFERAMIAERVRVGLRRAKDEGLVRFTPKADIAKCRWDVG
jgi:hypothetical protein